MKLSLPKFLLEFSGNAYICKQPMFFHYKPHHHKITGKEVRTIINTIEPGDILLRRYDGYLNTMFTPGFWCHAAIACYEEKIVHAVSQGVVEEDILEFTRCDSIAVLRVRDITPPEQKKVVELAYQFLHQGWKYDYEFARGNGMIYCTELADSCHNGLFFHEFSNEMGNFLLTPDHIFDSEHVDRMLTIKH